MPLGRESEMDQVYGYPYGGCVTYHPSYEKLGGVPAIFGSEVHRSATGDAFGLQLLRPYLPSTRKDPADKKAKESPLDEARKPFTEDKDFKGYIHDVEANGGFQAVFLREATDLRRVQGKSSACFRSL